MDNIQQFVNLADLLFDGPFALGLPQDPQVGLQAILDELANNFPNEFCLEEIHYHVEMAHATVAHRVSGEMFDVSIILIRLLRIFVTSLGYVSPCNIGFCFFSGLW